MANGTGEALNVGVVLIVAFLIITSYLMWSASVNASPTYCVSRRCHHRRKKPEDDDAVGPCAKKSVRFSTVENFSDDGPPRQTNGDGTLFDRITNAARDGLNGALLGFKSDTEEGFTPRRVTNQANELRLIRLAAGSRPVYTRNPVQPPPTTTSTNSGWHRRR